MKKTFFFFFIIIFIATCFTICYNSKTLTLILEKNDN